MPALTIGEFARRTRLSIKALHRYDELGVLVPARVDPASGYRYYDVAQLGDAHLILMLRQLELPLATAKELLLCQPADAAGRVAAHWRDAEAVHSSRRDLAGYLIDLLNGRRTMNYLEVSTRDIPERSLLCVKRNVDEEGALAFGKEFVSILRDRPVPRLPGRAGATFSIYWGGVELVGHHAVERSESCQNAPCGNRDSDAAPAHVLYLGLVPAFSRRSGARLVATSR